MKKNTTKKQTPLNHLTVIPEAQMNTSSTQQQMLEMQKMIQKMFIIIVILVVAVGGILVKDLILKNNVAPTPTPTTATPQAGAPTDPFALLTKYPTITSDDYVQGNRNAKYQMIEYSDLQCPFCHRFYPTAVEFLSKHKDVAFVYRHYPLDSIHPQAVPAAIASECVAKLGGAEAFYKFVDKVFTAPEDNTGSLDATQFPVWAGDSGVDVAAFNSCTDAKETKTRVDAQQKSGNSYGVNGTPATFLVNVAAKKAVLIPGAYPIDQVEVAFAKVK